MNENFFNTHDLIVTILALYSLIPAYLIYRGISSFLFKSFPKFYSKLHNSPMDEKQKAGLKILYAYKLLPKPEWTIEQRNNWESSWLKYGVAGVINFVILMYFVTGF